MATNLAIDEKLLSEAVKVGGFKTKKSAVNQALKEFIEHRKRKDILKVFGSIEMEPAYDHKQSRRMR
ncbi:MAG: type II toxin-antitoxin system VapB family antitoxin [Nitrospiraceae bacterium]|nr:type II toxin-antitoxin system VapB family antitoxin [Nitrospiraceae bacterium]MDA8327280.1 type II toxin-antitoxin system VapB family antitoxin [Nitrospiraceae bacterium]